MSGEALGSSRDFDNSNTGDTTTFASSRKRNPVRPAAVGQDAGFSALELAVVVLVVGILVALALPPAVNAVSDYRLHSDALEISSFLNVGRMRAASQYAPYRLVASIRGGTYALERLCGNTPASGPGGDPNCTSAYNPFTNLSYDALGEQYLSRNDTFSSCRPTGIGAYPGAITADAAGCPAGGPDPLDLYFNTRGAPVDSVGNPLANGGAALYIENQNNMVDAVTVSVGGRVAVWNWDTSANKWAMR